MAENKDTDENGMSERETFVMLMKYSTPLTVAILLYVGFVFLDGDIVTLVPIVILVILEIIIGLKADELYDYFNSKEKF
jgi:hypothetical protein